MRKHALHGPLTGARAGTMWVHNPRAAAMREALDDAKIMGTERSVTTSFAFSGRVSGAHRSNVNDLGCCDGNHCEPWDAAGMSCHTMTACMGCCRRERELFQERCAHVEQPGRAGVFGRHGLVIGLSH